MSLLRLVRDVDRLNKRYGGFFGLRVVVYCIIAAILTTIIMFSISFFIKYKDSKESFVLDSDKKYIVDTIFPEVSEIYCEIDFENGKVVTRKDSEMFKREKINKIDTDLEKLEKLVIEIVNNKENLTISDEEKIDLYEQNCYWLYTITDWKQDKYYIKDAEQIELYKELIKNAM